MCLTWNLLSACSSSATYLFGAMAEELPANARMMSKAWSTNTLEAGKAVIEQQQVKEESDDEVKEMEAELEASTKIALALQFMCNP